MFWEATTCQQRSRQRPLSSGERAGLLAGEVVHRYGVFEERIIAGDHGDATVGDEVTGTVGFSVVPDGGAFRQMHVAIDNAATDTTVTPYCHVREKDGSVDL